MPTYQYACTQCDHAFEQVQSFSDDALTVCPRCEGRLRKVFNAVGVVFKGSGFYRTDSRAKAGEPGENGAAGKPEKSGEKAGATASTGSSDGSGSAAAGSSSAGTSSSSGSGSKPAGSPSGGSTSAA